MLVQKKIQQTLMVHKSNTNLHIKLLLRKSTVTSVNQYLFDFNFF